MDREFSKSGCLLEHDAKMSFVYIVYDEKCTCASNYLPSTCFHGYKTEVSQISGIIHIYTSHTHTIYIFTYITTS